MTAIYDGAAFLLPWNHPDRLAAEEPVRLRQWLLRLCRLDRIALRRLPAGPEREIVALQLRCRQRSLARSRLSRAMLTYGVHIIGTEPWWKLWDELVRQGELRTADEEAWGAMRRRLDSAPDPIEAVRRRAQQAARRPALPRCVGARRP